MRQDKIQEIGIDSEERLYIKPTIEKFTMIYRSTAEIHWDTTGLFLYSPKPREWSYLDWYKHIVSLIQTDCDCQLVLVEETKWINIDKNLKEQIINTI